MSATRTTLDSLLKDFYLGPVQEQLNNEMLVLGEVRIDALHVAASRHCDIYYFVELRLFFACIRACACVACMCCTHFMYALLYVFFDLS